MSTPLDAQLIDAVEAGSEADVKRLIEAGASPDAHKRVTLRAKVQKEGIFGDVGGFEWKEDSIECESAFVLAVLHARVGVVRVLLENGATVDGKVEWKFSNFFGSRHWTSDEWQHQRWAYTYSFPSVLALAIGRGGTFASWDGSTYEVPTSDGKLSITLEGCAVALNHPEKWNKVGVTFRVRPNLDNVLLLLKHGAGITNAELEAARKHANQDFLRALESHKRRRLESFHLAKAAIATNIQELTTRVTGLEQEVLRKEVLNQEMSA